MCSVNKLLIGLLLLSSLITAGCGPKKEELTYIFWGDTTELAMNDHWIKEFEQTNKGISIKPCPMVGQDITSKILTMHAGDNAPDVMYIWREIFPDFLARDVYMPLNDMIKKDQLQLEDWDSNLMQAYADKNTIYGFPRSWHPYVIYYNKDIFDAAGVPYPDESWDWKKLLEMGKKLSKDTNNDGKIDQFALYDYPWQILVWSNGGKLFSDDGKKCYFNMPETIEALQFYKDLIFKHHISPRPSDAREGGVQLFLMGRVAMIGSGLWIVPKLRESKLKWDIAPVFKQKKRVTKLTTAGWAISKKTKHPEQAWKFVKYLSGTPGQDYQMKLWRDLSGLKNTFKKFLEYEQDKPPFNRKVISDAVQYGKFVEVFPGSYEIYGKIVSKYVEELTSDEKITAAEACKSIVDNYSKSLAAK